MSKHTPGPWSAEPDAIGGDTAVVEALSKDRRYVRREICHVLLDDSDQKSRNLDKANLLLIAAAPDLLAACENALEWLACDEPEEAIVVIRAAIAKAVGK